MWTVWHVLWGEDLYNSDTADSAKMVHSSRTPSPSSLYSESDGCVLNCTHERTQRKGVRKLRHWTSERRDHSSIAETKPLLALASPAIACEIRKERNKEPISAPHPAHNKGSHLRILPSQLWYLKPSRDEWQES